LIDSTTTGPEWGQAYTYDGWGNRTSQTLTKGGNQSYLSYNGLTNRITTAGYGYDANGNLTTMPGVSGLTYDVENRLLTANSETYSYGPDNRRVWLRKSAGTEYIYFYGITGRRIGVYRKFTNLSLNYLSLERDEVYFAGKRIKSGSLAVTEDRLGSTRKEGGTASKFYPYGEEFGAGTAEDRTKFATYHRDSGTSLDYADQRYYDRLSGRFLTADTVEGKPCTPQSWNLSAYVQGDPVGFNDPNGALPANVSYGGGFGCLPMDSFAPRDTIDASSPCPPGFTIAYGQYGASKSRLRQVRDAFEGLGGLIEDWDYANDSGTRFNITLSAETFMTAFWPQLAGAGAGGVVLLGGGPVTWTVTVTGAIIISGVVLWQTGVLQDILSKASKSARQLIECSNQYARDLKNCAEAYPPGADRQACFAAAKAAFDRCLGRGVN
jgi:RHS repeat-associated protein